MTKLTKQVAKSRAKAAKATPARKPAPERAPRGTQKAKIIALLKRPEGASIEEVLRATGWKKRPSVHGMFALLRQQGHAVIRMREAGEPKRGGNRYTIG